MEITKKVVTTYGEGDETTHVEFTVKVTPEQHEKLDNNDYNTYLEVCDFLNLNLGYSGGPGHYYCHRPSYRVCDNGTVVFGQWSGLDV